VEEKQLTSAKGKEKGKGWSPATKARKAGSKKSREGRKADIASALPVVSLMSETRLRNKKKTAQTYYSIVLQLAAEEEKKGG